jgi:membrane protease YdiL (CAAX protease family)
MHPEPVPEQKPRSLLANIFLSPDERRLRAGWRLSAQMIILWMLSAIFVIILGFLLVYAGGGISSASDFLVFQLASALAITLSVYIARVFLDNRTFASLGLLVNRRMWVDLATGIGIGFSMFLVVFLLLYFSGWVRIDGFAWQTQSAGALLGTLFSYLFIYFVVGWQEELLFRGYWLQNLADGTNLRWGILLSSVIFSLFHLANPGMSWISTLGLFLAGLFLAYGYVATRSLWLPIGLHIGWNFFEGPFFGFKVSGLSGPVLIEHTVLGPDLVTGGIFGPEAGLVLVPALLVGTLLIYLIYQRHTSIQVSTEDL